MTSDGKLIYEESDLDAKTNYPVKDMSDKLCALIKVTVVNELKYPLLLDVGTIYKVVDRVEKENGEVWFYISPQTRNIKFTCKGYNPIEVTNVPAIRPGGVYRITITASSVGVFVHNAVVTSNYLNLKVFPPDAKVSVGSSKEYEEEFKILLDGTFSRKLYYGLYYYKVEHPLYKTWEDTVTVHSGDCSRTVSLLPAFGYLSVVAKSQLGDDLDAQVFIDSKVAGQTPLNYQEKLPNGEIRVQVQKEDYYPVDTVVSIPGDSLVYPLELVLRPNFGFVQCLCEDGKAELWIDAAYKGVGSWSGNLPSGSYILEARKEGHESQRVNFRVEDGKNISVKVSRPEPLYGTLDMNTDPIGCTVKLDGEVIKPNAPAVYNKILAVSHIIELSKDGYIPLRDTIAIKHNEVLRKEYKLEKGEINARVEIYTDRESRIYADNMYLGTGSWIGLLPIGKYEMRSVKDGFKDGTCIVNVEEKDTNKVTIPFPTPKFGKLQVTSNVKGASIFLRTSDMQYISSNQVTPYTFAALIPGEYSISLQKDGYETSDFQNVFVLENEMTKLKIRMNPLATADTWGNQYRVSRKLNEKSSLKNDSPFASYFIDLNLGFDRDGYLLAGASCSWVKARFGAYGAFQMMLEDISNFTISAGPVVRLTPDVVDLQVYAGLAYIYDEIGADMGLRIGWKSKSGLSLWDFGAGCMVSGSHVIPTVSVGCGISLVALATIVAALLGLE